MSTYTAPLDEMRFVLREVARPAAGELPGYDDTDEALVDAVIEQAGRFATDVLAPLNAAGDRQGCRLENAVVRVPDGFGDAYRAFVDGGWNSLAFPAEYGGQALPGLLATAVFEIWSAANMSFATCPLLTQSAALLLLLHGDAGMRARYLPKLVSGECTGTMLLTEPQAGSDLAQVRDQGATAGRPLSPVRAEDLRHLRRA